MTSGSGGPSRDLREAARPDASALQRSAVMLTGAADAADGLVLATLHRADRNTHAAGRSGPDPLRDPDSALLAALVREYLRRSSRRRVDRVEPVGVGGDASDVLDSLRPRQRAAAVLMLVEGWSAEHTARVLGVAPERIPSLVPQTVGLADALQEVAYHQDGPAPDLFTAVPALPACGQDEADRRLLRPATDGNPPGPPTAAPGHTLGRPGRRSSAVRRSAAAAAAVVALGCVALAASLYGQDEGSPRPVVGGTAGSAASPGDLSGRGWVLGPGGDPPVFLEGLRLIDVSTIDYADATGPLSLHTLPHKGQAMYAALWCDMPPRDTDLVPPTVRLTLSGHTVALPCAGRHDDPAVDRLVPLPPPADRGRVPVTLEWDGDLPGRGSAVLATYTEFGQNEPPRTPLLVSAAPPPVPEGATVLDGDHVSIPFDGGELFVQRVTVSSETRLSIWSGTTGRFTILVDGIIATDDGDLRYAQTTGGSSPALAWQDQDPELRDGSWTIHAAGRTKQFPLPEVLRPAPGQEREVTVQVHVDMGAEDRWQVQASHASPVLVDSPPAPQTPGPATHIEGR